MLQHCKVVVNLCVWTIEIERMLFSEVRILRPPYLKKAYGSGCESEVMQVLTAVLPSIIHSILNFQITTFKFSDGTYLTQFLGSLSQSILHLNRSQINHPIGGVLARPLSNACVLTTHNIINASANIVLV